MTSGSSSAPQNYIGSIYSSLSGHLLSQETSKQPLCMRCHVRNVFFCTRAPTPMCFVWGFSREEIRPVLPQKLLDQIFSNKLHLKVWKCYENRLVRKIATRWRSPHCVLASDRREIQVIRNFFALRESTQHKALHHCEPALTHACMIIVHVRGCVVIGLPEARWPLFGYLSGASVQPGPLRI